MRGGVAGVADDEFIRGTGARAEWPPQSVSAHRLAVHGGAGARAAGRIGGVDLDRRAGQGQVRRKAADQVVQTQARHLAVEHHAGFGCDGQRGGGLAGDEAVGRVERLRAERGFAVVDAVDHDIGGALQFGAGKGHVGRCAFGAYPHAVGLGELVVVGRPNGQPLHAGRDLVAVRAFRCVQRHQERAGPVEFVAGAVGNIGPHTVVRRAAEDGVRHLGGAAAVSNVVAHRVAAARVGKQHHFRGAGGFQHLVDFGRQELHVLGGRGAAVLRLGVVVARQRVRHVDGMQPFARPAVRLEPPQRGGPQRGGVAVAVHEDDGRRRAGRRHASAGAQQGRCGQGQQAQQGEAAVDGFQHRRVSSGRKGGKAFRVDEVKCGRLA